MIDETPTPRNLGPFRSWLANLLVPGAGYLYVGRPRLAAGLLVLILGALFLGCWTRLILLPWGLYLLAAFLILVPIVAAPLHAAWIARRTRQAPRHSYNHWWAYLGYGLLVFGLFTLLGQYRAPLLGYEPFRIPSASMAPTVQKGDFILSNTWAYRNDPPERGDLVVLHASRASDTRYIKRVVAIPGDTVALENGVLIVNGQAVDEPYLHAPRAGRPYGRDVAALSLASDQFYLLGDNRDNSLDSRRWGPVGRDQIEGKALYIWYSASEEDGIRWQRFPNIF